MWNSWYSASMWKLWAWSSNGSILSCLWTTMTAESHWRHLKHTHLGFMHHPWLDQTIYTIINNVIPAELLRMRELDGVHLIGHAPPLTNFQKQVKKAWLELSKHSCSEKNYNTDIKRWTCQCGGQQLQAHHLCKHLVQAVETLSPRPPDFFEKFMYCHMMPIYQFPHISNNTPDSGSISDGNDEIWMGQWGNVSWGGWRQLYAPQTWKQSCSPSIEVTTQLAKWVCIPINLHSMTLAHGSILYIGQGKYTYTYQHQ